MKWEFQLAREHQNNVMVTKFLRKAGKWGQKESDLIALESSKNLQYVFS